MKPGSLLWLLRHELRLWWRDIRSRPGLMIWSIALGILFAGFFLVLWGVLGLMRDQISAAAIGETLVQAQAQGRSTSFQSEIDTWVFWGATIAWLIAFAYALIQAMQQSAYALFDRGDLDLLVSSPVSSQVIFASRLIGVALRVFLNYCPIVVPALLLAIAIGLPQLVGAIPALVGICLATASLAMLLTLALVRWLGARQARTVAQILTAGLSAILFLGSQLPNLLRGTAIAPAGSHWAELQNWFAADGIFSPTSLLWFPVRALFLEPVSVLLTLLTSSGLAWLAVRVLHRSFIAGTQQAVTTPQRSRSPDHETRFSGGFKRVVLMKEWRIIWRNPYLLSATFLQVLFLIPALVIVLRGESGSLGNFSTFVTVTSIVIGESLTQTLTRICVAGEESPDLLRSSPLQGAVLRRLKLLAALLPVWLVLSPLFVILLLQKEPWFLPLLVFGMATTCAAVLRLWNSQPIRLADIGKRQQSAQGDLVLGILETISLFTWAWLGFVVNSSLVWLVVLPIALLVMVLAIAYWRSQQLGSSLGF